MKDCIASRLEIFWFLRLGPDSAGIIMARFEQETVQVFERDLEEGCEPIEIQVAKPGEGVLTLSELAEQHVNSYPNV